MTSAEQSLHAIGSAIRHARTQRGLSQQELADLLGINRQYLVDLEHGRATTQLRRLVALLNSLGLDLVVSDRAAGP